MIYEENNYEITEFRETLINYRTLYESLKTYSAAAFIFIDGSIVIFPVLFSWRE